MRAVGIVGRSGSGKTTLIERLLPLLRARGVAVSTVKRTHHSVDLDPPGKDSRRHRDAGAEEVLLVSDRRWALLRETPDPPPLQALLARLAPVDLVLVEGFKSAGLPQIEVYRAGLGKAPLWPEAPSVLAVAAEMPVAGMPSWLPLNEAVVVARWITDFVSWPDAAA